MQITSAMKMVSAAKLKRAQDAVTRMRPYAEKLHHILSNLSASLDNSENIYSVNREVKNVLLIVVTSNRGLCGLLPLGQFGWVALGFTWVVFSGGILGMLLHTLLRWCVNKPMS